MDPSSKVDQKFRKSHQSQAPLHELEKVCRHLTQQAKSTKRCIRTVGACFICKEDRSLKLSIQKRIKEEAIKRETSKKLKRPTYKEEDYETVLGFPQGKIEPDRLSRAERSECICAALIREICEETGLKLNDYFEQELQKDISIFYVDSIFETVYFVFLVSQDFVKSLFRSHRDLLENPNNTTDYWLSKKSKLKHIEIEGFQEVSLENICDAYAQYQNLTSYKTRDDNLSRARFENFFIWGLVEEFLIKTMDRLQKANLTQNL